MRDWIRATSSGLGATSSSPRGRRSPVGGLDFVLRLLGILAKRLRVRWIKQRWHKLRGSTRSTAPISPAAPSRPPSDPKRQRDSQVGEACYRSLTCFYSLAIDGNRQTCSTG